MIGEEIDGYGNKMDMWKLSGSWLRERLEWMGMSME